MKTKLIKKRRYFLVLLMMLGIGRLGYGQAQIAPYPIIFVHGLTSNQHCFDDFAKTLLEMHGGSLEDLNTLHFCLIHDGNKHTSNVEDDVARLGWDHGGSSKYGVYAINFDAKMTQYLNDHPDAELSNQAAIYKQGKALSIMIPEVLNFTKAKKVILIGHSMGGLAIREYLQRRDENGRHIWWVDPNDEFSGHHVAKIGTIATPHGGSDVPLSTFTLLGKDLSSEAKRDLDPESVYLIGGNEGSIKTGISGYYNRDVNCNGSDSYNITGLNNFYFPENLAYSCIIGTGDKAGADINFSHSGDGMVSEYRANLDNFTGNEIVVDTFKVKKPNPLDLLSFWHSEMLKKFSGLIRILDEPQTHELAYEIGENSTTKGIITYQTDYNQKDIDLYKIVFNKHGHLKISLKTDANTGVREFNLLNGELMPRKSITAINPTFDEILTENFPEVNYGDSFTHELDIESGTYYIQIKGKASTDTYKNQYSLTTEFVPELPTSLNVSIKSLQFYDVLIGSPKPKTIKLTNNGDVATTINRLDFTGSSATQFESNTAAPFVIAPGESVNVVVAFNPDSEGLKTANLEIFTNSNETPEASIELQGIGVATATIVLAMNIGDSYNFGNFKINTSRSKTFTIQNTGSNSCTISNLSIEGFNNDQYTITSPSVVPFDIGWGETKSITVRFTPKSIGSKNAQLAIHNNSDNFAPVRTIELYGNGTPNYFSGNNNSIIAYEYWFDDKYESRIKQSFTQKQLIEIDIDFPTDELNVGLHSLHIRVKDSKGKWSAVKSQYVYKNANTSEGGRSIKACEYWFDDDFASKVATSVTAEQTITMNSSLDVSSLHNGLHSYHVRYKDNSGQWSSVVSEFFYKLPVSGTNLITNYRYWFDRDETNIKTVNLPAPENPYQLISDLNTCGLAEGDHTIHFQFQDSNHLWSSVITDTITKSASLAPEIAVTGAKTFCEGEQVTLTASTADSYLWSNGATTQSIEVTQSGNYSVTVNKEIGCEKTSEVTAIVVNSLPKAAGDISGLASVTQNQSNITYSVPAIDDANSYVWTLPEGASGASTTNSISISYGNNAISGEIKVKGHNDCGDGPESVLGISVASIQHQDIALNTGWNIVSANVVPADLTLTDLFQNLIDTGTLKKVMDDTGKTIENIGAAGDWKNDIGNLNTTKGYKVNVTAASTLSLDGPPVQLPLEINLNAGWNIVSYPSEITQDAMALFQSLIDDGKLKKVMDESGKTIEYFGEFGGWVNNIGNLLPGKGYKVNVTANCTLIIPANGTNLTITEPNFIASEHFKPIFIGNGTDHMSINLVNLQTSGLQAGDELGIFDGKNCVGSAIVAAEQLIAGFISIPVSANDNLSETTNGFIDGNLVELQLYRGGQISVVKLTKISGNELFESNGSLFATINVIGVTTIPLAENPTNFKCFPNPFTQEITIEVQNPKQTEIIVEIYNMAGQRIKNLFKGTKTGHLILKWNGTNETGQQVVPGAYICKVNGQSKQVIFEGKMGK